jgi:hypothetical protein
LRLHVAASPGFAGFANPTANEAEPCRALGLLATLPETSR